MIASFDVAGHIIAVKLDMLKWALHRMCNVLQVDRVLIIHGGPCPETRPNLSVTPLSEQ